MRPWSWPSFVCSLLVFTGSPAIQSMFLVYDRGVVVVDAPQTLGAYIPRDHRRAVAVALLQCFVKAKRSPSKKGF